MSVCLCVCNKKYFRSSALTPFRDLRFKTLPRKLCSATLTLSRTLEMTSRARPLDVSGYHDPAIANSDFGVEMPSSTRLQTLRGLGARFLFAVTATCLQHIQTFAATADEVLQLQLDGPRRSHISQLARTIGASFYKGVVHTACLPDNVRERLRH